jgi:hypothetical protein
LTLVELEPLGLRGVELWLRLAQIRAEGLGDLPRAIEACRRALALDPADLPATERLAQLLAREGELTVLSAHLDQTLNLHRMRLFDDPTNVASYQTLRRVFEWQKAHDKVFCACAALELLGEARPEDLTVLRSLGQRGTPATGDSAGDPLPPPNSIDEEAFETLATDPGYRGALRQLLAQGREIFAKLNPRNLTALGITSKQRLSSSAAPRLSDALREVCRVAGSSMLELYMAPGYVQGIAAIPNGTTPVLVTGWEELRKQPIAEMRFHLGRAVALARDGGFAARALQPRELGLYVGALFAEICAQPWPSMLGAGPPAADAAELQKRVDKALSRKLRKGLAPYALEVLGGTPSPATISERPVWNGGPVAWQQVMDSTADRVALLCSGDLKAAMTALLRAEGLLTGQLRRPQDIAPLIRQSASAQRLMLFASSDDYAALRRRLGVASGP